MASLDTVFDELRRGEDGLTLLAPPLWSQGRTLYGGMTAALCFEAARAFAPPDARLRSAQFAFIGPASGSLRLVPTIARQGRSLTVVLVDLLAGDALAARATLLFGAARQSEIAYDLDRPPAVPPPGDCPSLFPDSRSPPGFVENFDVRLAQGSALLSGGAPTFTLWVRFRNRQTVDPVSALLALADSPPPAAMAMFPRPAAISTSTWSLDVMHAPDEIDDWHLLRSRGEQAGEGYAMQDMTLWNSAGRRLMQGRQCVAIFI